MELITAKEAWQWVQIGFCGGVGACAVYVVASVLLASVLPSTPISLPEPPEPHCSRCCPNGDDDLPFP